jgi:transposase-like protein
MNKIIKNQKCDCGGGLKKQGSCRRQGNLVPRYKCIECSKFISSQRKYQKMTPEIKKSIIRLSCQGLSLHQVADKVGYSHTTVANIINVK